MKRNKLIVLALSVLVLAGAFLFTNEMLFKAEINENTKIVEGVYIGGIDVSGMTTKEATDAVNAYVEEIKAETVTLQGPAGSITVTYGELGLTAEVDKAVSKAVMTAQYGNLIARFMNQKDLETDHLVLSMNLKIDKQLTGNLLYNNQNKLNQTSVNGSVVRENYKFTYVPGKDGVEIIIVDSVNRLANMIAEDFEFEYPEEMVFNLNSETVLAKGTAEDFANMTIIGEFATWYETPDQPERMQNVETGCSKLNGQILFPGEELSVLDVTGPYTVENGYGIGFSYLPGGIVTESIGGGICQVSTTIYNAVIRAELEVVKRYAHSMTVAYVPISADAAIATGYKDFVFKNNYDFPIYIEGIAGKGVLTFRIYGQETRDPNRTIEFEEEILETVDPEGEYTLDPNLGVGKMRLQQSEHKGYTARYWKIIKIDGVEVERIKVNSSYYTPGKAIGTIGIKGATDEEMKIIKDVLATKDDQLIIEVITSIRKPVETPEDSETTEEGTEGSESQGSETPGTETEGTENGNTNTEGSEVEGGSETTENSETSGASVDEGTENNN